MCVCVCVCVCVCDVTSADGGVDAPVAEQLAGRWQGRVQQLAAARSWTETPNWQREGYYPLDKASRLDSDGGPGCSAQRLCATGARDSWCRRKT